MDTLTSSNVNASIQTGSAVRYFVKFVGDRNVTLARAHDDYEAEVLLLNQYEPTTPDFYEWLRQNTRSIAGR